MEKGKYKGDKSKIFLGKYPVPNLVVLISNLTK